jgi:dihydrofolate reductase
MINIIVAASLNNVIGKDNSLIWRQSADLKRFKELTTGKTVVMGRKTYDSIGKPLPNRRNVVITRQNIEIPGCEVVHSLEEAIKLDDEIFILGGGEIYQKSIILADRIYLTRLHVEVEGDTYFPQLCYFDWKIENIESFKKDDKNQFDYQFITYVR